MNNHKGFLDSSIEYVLFPIVCLPGNFGADDKGTRSGLILG